MSAQIISEFNLKVDVKFYDVDEKTLIALKQIIEVANTSEASRDELFEITTKQSQK